MFALRRGISRTKVIYNSLPADYGITGALIDGTNQLMVSGVDYLNFADGGAPMPTISALIDGTNNLMISAVDFLRWS